jgi:hypothetical protein
MPHRQREVKQHTCLCRALYTRAQRSDVIHRVVQAQGMCYSGPQGLLLCCHSAVLRCQKPERVHKLPTQMFCWTGSVETTRTQDHLQPCSSLCVCVHKEKFQPAWRSTL